jgi:DNA polymerase III subunit gamma/tau
MRDSISLLDQIITDPNEPITVELAQRVLGSASSRATRDLVDAIITQDAATGLTLINDAVDTGADPRQFGQQLVEYLRNVLLAQTAGIDLIEASQEEKLLYTQQAHQLQRPVLVRVIRAFNDAVNNYRGGWQPQLTLELALIESLRPVEQEYAAAPVVQAVPQPPAMPEPEPTPPGSPPAVPVASIQSEWAAVLSAMYRHNKSSPAVMQNFHVQRVDGTTVYLATDNSVLFERVNPFPDKKKVVERALYDVFKVALRVQVVLINGGDSSASAEQPNSPTPSDPLLSEAIRRGGRVKQDKG